VRTPDPPPAPEDLSRLLASYEHPSAIIPSDQVLGFALAAKPYIDIAQLLAGLKFTRTLISETSVGLDANTAAADLSVSGLVRASLPCFGDGPARSFDAESNGTVSASLGVEDSRLKHGFEGRFERCLFRVEPALVAPQRVRLSATMIGDLGVDLAIGSEIVGPLMVKMRDIVVESSGGLGTFDDALDEFHFRLAPDGSLDTLLDGATLGLGATGTLLLSLRVDGMIALRDSRGEWSCDAGVTLCRLVN
jgi:hypothetical protein